jgi:hypothetical protein
LVFCISPEERKALEVSKELPQAETRGHKNTQFPDMTDIVRERERERERKCNLSLATILLMLI